ncbi:hypothetical protein ACIRLA_46250 [Streptomyces sp. NPDC102364]|uniref:hypothetical protein n=1 Tax=Streptomyces sp. NPDC102364 TaxID=3366161 RepID=UPI00381B7587
MTDDLPQMISARRGELQRLEEKLAEQLTDVRTELADLTVAEGVAQRLIAQRQARAETDEAAAAAERGAPGPGKLVPQKTRALKAGDLPEPYRGILACVAEATMPLMARELPPLLGMPAPHVPAQVESVRTKLNRLAERGWLAKTDDGRFTA